MTKQNLIDLVIDWLSGGDITHDLKSKYHPVVISKHIEMAYSAYAKRMFQEAKSTGNHSNLDSFTKVFEDVDVLYNDKRKKYYSILPSEILQLPDGGGIRSISPMEEEEYQFGYIENNSMPVYMELELSKIGDVATYMIESNNVIYQNLPADITKLLMKLIVPFSSLSKNDNVGLPTGGENEIFRLVIELLSKKPNEDLNNNNREDRN